MTESNMTADPRLNEVMMEMAKREIAARDARAAEDARLNEYNDALEKVLADPSLAAHKDRLKEFAGASSLKKFGKDGLVEAMHLFNERLKLEEGKPKSDTIPGKAADPGVSKSSVAGDHKSSAIPKLPDGGYDWLSVNIDTVEPSQRNEVLRKQAIQSARNERKRYGW